MPAGQINGSLSSRAARGSCGAHRKAFCGQSQMISMASRVHITRTVMAPVPRRGAQNIAQGASTELYRHHSARSYKWLPLEMS